MVTSYKNITIRPLEKKDREQIRILDDESENNVWMMYVEEKRFGIESDALGLFLGNHLVAYLTVTQILKGDNDVLRYLSLDEDSSYRHLKSDSRFIEDIYVLNDYRGFGFGMKLIGEVLAGTEADVFLLSGSRKLIPYYERLGFEHIGNCSMVFHPSEKVNLAL